MATRAVRQGSCDERLEDLYVEVRLLLVVGSI
jgi:hypothetical protein